MEPLTLAFQKLVQSKKALEFKGVTLPLDLGEFNYYRTRADAMITSLHNDDKDYTVYFLMDAIDNPNIVVRSSFFGKRVGRNGYVTLSLEDRFYLDPEPNGMTVRLGELSTGWPLTPPEEEYVDYDRINQRCHVKNTVAKMLAYLKAFRTNKHIFIEEHQNRNGGGWQDAYMDKIHHVLKEIAYYGGTENFIVEYEKSLLENQ